MFVLEPSPFGDGSIGIQVSELVGRIAIDTGLVTHGEGRTAFSVEMLDGGRGPIG